MIAMLVLFSTSPHFFYHLPAETYHLPKKGRFGAALLLG